MYYAGTTRDNVGMIKVPRIHAITVACAIKILMDFNTDSEITETVDWIRMIVAIREYAQRRDRSSGHARDVAAGRRAHHGR